MDTRTDMELVAAAQRGSQDAVGVLFDRHWRRAWGAAFAVTGDRAAADDVAQDAFQRAIRSIARFDGRRPFAAWLHRIVVNGAIDAHRRSRRQEALMDDHPAPGRLEAALDATDLARALASLPVDQRAAVVAHHVLGYSLAETAELLGVPLGTAQSRCGRGIAALRQMLGVTDAR